MYVIQVYELCIPGSSFDIVAIERVVFKLSSFSSAHSVFPFHWNGNSDFTVSHCGPFIQNVFFTLSAEVPLVNKSAGFESVGQYLHCYVHFP